MRNAFFRKFGPHIVLLMLLSVATIGLYVGSDRLFAIKNIEVVGDPVEVVVRQEKLPKNLLFFPASKLEEELLKDNPLLFKLELKKKFPNTLVIVATRRKPIAKIDLQSLVGLIDNEGYIIGLDDGTAKLPVIRLESVDAVVGQRVNDPAVDTAIRLIGALPPEYVIKNITRFDRLSIIAELAQTSIIVTQENDQYSLSATLQTILEGFRIKGTMPTRIDLRFDKPVIEF